MEKSDVKEIFETTNKDQVNKLLEAGWILIETASGKWPDSQEAQIRYSLGWVKELPSIKPSH